MTKEIISENIILKDNIKEIRRLIEEGLLLEAASQNQFVSAINNRKIMVIYYDGEDTIKKGYRKVAPFVTGISLAGNPVVRAWEFNGDSDSFSGLKPRRRYGHEYFDKVLVNTPKGKNIEELTIKDITRSGEHVPGWRLFRLDGIKSAVFTGEKFNNIAAIFLTDEGKKETRYNPNDNGMKSIVAKIDSIDKTLPQTKPPTDDDEIKTTLEKVPDAQRELDKINNELDKTNKLTKEIINDLYNLATKYKKKSVYSYIVVKDEDGDITIVNDTPKNKQKYGNNIFGNLKELNDKYNKIK